MEQPIDKEQVLADYDEQAAAVERVCAKMKSCRLKLEVAMALPDAEFEKIVKDVSVEVAAAMDEAHGG